MGVVKMNLSGGLFCNPDGCIVLMFYLFVLVPQVLTFKSPSSGQVLLNEEIIDEEHWQQSQDSPHNDQEPPAVLVHNRPAPHEH